MEHELTCCICLEFFDNPVMLPCSHNLCLMCVGGLVNSQVKSNAGRCFKCPSCRFEVKLDPVKGINGLPQNKTLNNILKLFEVSNICESPSPEKVKICSKHSKPLISYCRFCKVVICCICEKESHLSFGHAVTPINDAIQEEKANGQANHSLMELNMTNDQTSSLKNTIKDVQQHKCDIEDRARRKFQHLLRLINSKEEDFMMGLDAEIYRQLLPYHNLVNKLEKLEQDRQELCREYKATRAWLNEKNLYKQLQGLQTYNKKVSALLSRQSVLSSQIPPKLDLPNWSVMADMSAVLEKITWNQGTVLIESGNNSDATAMHYGRSKTPTRQLRSNSGLMNLLPQASLDDSTFDDVRPLPDSNHNTPVKFNAKHALSLKFNFDSPSKSGTPSPTSRRPQRSRGHRSSPRKLQFRSDN